MKRAILAAAVFCIAFPPAPRAQQLKPQTVSEFDCYIQSAEARMNARKAFLLADTDAALNDQLVKQRKITTVAPNGANPHKISGGHVYDWIGAVFIPGVNAERAVRMLQDYDHRAEYFTQTISSSKVLCRTGENHFRYTMRMKEPAVMDVESDVVWERVDAKRWKCRSYSTSVKEVQKEHGYVQRLYTYWRVAETDKGVYIEGQGIELSKEFGALARSFGSALMGINPEKSLRHSLESMRDALLKPGMQFPAPPAGTAACGEPFRPGGCVAVSSR